MSPQFMVADIGRSIEFYTYKLGFTIDFRYEDFYAGIIKDGWSIHLKAAEAAPHKPSKMEHTEDLDIVFSVEGIEDLFSELSANSIEFIQPLRDMPYGREFYIADPDGHIIAFLEQRKPDGS
jgi:catechol 2,3-dioxygenase-like lactoylglutathione lyase family enzyme